MTNKWELPESCSAPYKSSFVQNILLFLFHMALLCGFSLFAFNHNSGRLFIGNDGPMMISLASEQLRYFGISTALHTNFLQGLGNISFPINVSAMPGFWFKLYKASGPLFSGIVYTYTWFAMLMFSTVVIAGQNYNFSRGICYSSAWLLTILFFPYIENIGIYSITASAPAFVMYPFAAAVADFGIWHTGRGGWRSTILYAAMTLAGIMIMLITSPAALILILPFLCVSASISFLRAGHTERILKLSAALAIMLLFVACGWAEYVAGLLLNTSSGFFIKELMDSYPQDRIFISILFHGRSPGIFMGQALFLSGSIGAAVIFLSARSHYFAKNKAQYLIIITLLVVQALLLYAGEVLVHLWEGRMGPAIPYYEAWLVAACLLWVIKILYSSKRRDVPQIASLRPAAIVLLSGQGFLLVVGEWLMHRSGGWTGPALVYYEMPLFTLYALFTVFLAAQYLKKISDTYPVFARRFVPGGIHCALTVILVIIMTAYIWTDTVKSRAPINYAMPPASTDITTILEHEIGIRPGSPFAGRVASIIPDKGFISQIAYFSTLNASQGNDYQTTGLWLKGIPTLMEYNPLITPEFYSIIHRFLSAPGDIQNRSWTNFSQIDLRILRLLGVRFILSTVPDIKNAKERGSVAAPTPLHLFELEGANTAGISATKLVAAADVSRAEDSMAAPAFDLQTAVVINSGRNDLPLHTDTLVPAEDSRISIENGAYRVRARSSGWTMLILPVEYSRCLDITALSGEAPQAVRVDIALAGLVFYRQLDVALVQQVGPFTHPRCRFRDYLDFKAMISPASQKFSSGG